jgi:hypothetical protein
MTKSRGIGRGKNATGRTPSGPHEGPTYYLKKYKTTERPRPCQRCRQNAYYNHPDFGYLCAAHLLDLVNIGEMAFKWKDYEEMWDRTSRLLQRPLPGAQNATE